MTATACCCSTAATSMAAATCCASICRRRTRSSPASSSGNGSSCGAGSHAATCRSIASSGPSNGKGYPEVAQALNGQQGEHRAHQRPRRGDRLGRGAGAALPRRARRAAAVDPGRRHRPDGRGRAAGDLQGVPDRRRRDGGAVDAARRHHRRPGAAARRRRRARAPAHPLARRDSRLHRPRATRSGICPARCAT